MLVRTVPASAGLQPVKLGLFYFCEVCSELDSDGLCGSFSDGGTVGVMLSSHSMKAVVPGCCAVSIDDHGLLATCVFLLSLSMFNNV